MLALLTLTVVIIYLRWSAVKLDLIRLPLWPKNYGPRMPLILRVIMIKSYRWLSVFGKAPQAAG